MGLFFSRSERTHACPGQFSSGTAAAAVLTTMGLRWRASLFVGTCCNATTQTSTAAATGGATHHNTSSWRGSFLGCICGKTIPGAAGSGAEAMM
jgi:hypothetical protein